MPEPDPLPAGTAAPRIAVSSTSFASARADVAACFAFEGEKRPSVPGLPAASALAKTLARLMEEEGFKGKRREILVWHSAGRHNAARYMVVGLGRRPSGSEPAARESLREGCGLAARRAVGAKARKMVAALPPASPSEPISAMAEAAAEGFLLGSYRMSKYLTGEEGKAISLRTSEILTGRSDVRAAREGVRRGVVRAAATNLTRDLVNEPALALTPSRMAQVARRTARQRHLEIKVHEKKDLERMGMGGLLGVSAGSAQPPCLIHMIYTPRSSKRAGSIALVGKGLTFDSGGLSLKTASGMETMKLDKAGASVVLGVMSALPDLQPAVEVHGIMGMTENMPGGSAIKPGDVLRTMGGRTIEVLNTDAEGRVVLADALAYAQKQGVDRIVDLATLTGACMVALGPTVSGLFGTDQGMVDALIQAGRRAGERIWQLPLYDDYYDQLRSDIADIKNTPSSRYGGAITAALFLKSFLKEGVPWCHLDIAGPAFLEHEQGYMRRGGTGAMVRTLLSYIESLDGS